MELISNYLEQENVKLLRYGAAGSERPGALCDDGSIRDLASIIDDLDGKVLVRLPELQKIALEKLPIVSPSVRIGPCVGGVGKFICVGLNYADHAREANADIPGEPILFLKADSAISGPNDPVVIPPGSEKTDWEVELGVVIGKSARYIARRDALGHVAGYCVVNDISERSYQLERGGQWVKGKSSDGFGPIGPWLVTADEVTDPQSLRLWLEVDGKRYQDGSTKTMIFDVGYLISYISQFMTLKPGDIISTGTPPGVGAGQRPPVYLRPGQEVRLGVEGLGEQRQRVRAFDGQ